MSDPIHLRRESTGLPLLLAPGTELGVGGQATVYPAPEGRDVAKLYHRPISDQERKLRVMLAHRPAGASGGPDGGTLAWPEDLLYRADGAFAGLLLPRVEAKLRVFELYNPATRRERLPLFHHGLLHRAARNLAAAFDELHAAGYVVGDVNESNVLVGENGRVTLIDTDSFQVRDPATGEVYRCPVGRPEFTPPELRGASFGEVDRTPEHDRFGLGVLVFQMLMEGTHPFAGRYRGAGEPPPVQERIAAGHFPYARRGGGSVGPPRTAPPLEVLDPALRELLLRCFEDGHRDPAARPEAAEWRDVLEAAEAALVVCGRNEQHRFGAHLDACPWCERALRLHGRDPFPSGKAVRRGEHRRPPSSVPGAAGSAVQEPAGLVLRAYGAMLENGWAWLAVGAAALGLVAEDVGVILFLLAMGWLSFPAWRTALGVTRVRPLNGFLTALTVLLVGAGLVSTHDPLSDPAATSLTAPLPDGAIEWVPHAFASEAVDRKPAPLDLGPLTKPMSMMRDGPATRSGPSVVELVVDEDGRVEPATLAVEPASDSILVEALRPFLHELRFVPGERGGRPVRTQVRFMVRWFNGRVAPEFQWASWGPHADYLTREAWPGWQTPTAQEPPRLLNAAQMEELLDRTFPPERRRNGFEGTAIVRFRVDERGVVNPASIVITDCPDDAFAPSAAMLANRLRYAPATYAGKAVPAYVTIDLYWDLYS